MTTKTAFFYKMINIGHQQMLPPKYLNRQNLAWLPLLHPSLPPSLPTPPYSPLLALNVFHLCYIDIYDQGIITQFTYMSGYNRQNGGESYLKRNYA